MARTSPGERTVVAVLGLGEAGGRLARDLAAGGFDVRGFDPAAAAPGGVTPAAGIAAAVAGAALVLSANAAAVALEVARKAAPALAPGAVYADLNAAAPALKRELAELVGPGFADVALVGVVPREGVRTQSLASGPGARRYAELLAPAGAAVEVVGDEPGDAAALKLVRSVLTKGVAAAVLEALEAGRAVGAEARVRRDAAELIGAEWLERFVSGSLAHAARRADEMEAASALLAELGVEPHVAGAAARRLRELAGRRRACS